MKHAEPAPLLDRIKSPPVRGRGLKQRLLDLGVVEVSRRPPCGGVD